MRIPEVFRFLRCGDMIPRHAGHWFCVLLLSHFSLYRALQEIGDSQTAPRFRAKTLGGETLESVKGKVVLLEFWTTWCPYCRDEEALVERIDKQFASQGLIVLAIDLAESKKTVTKYLDQHPPCRIVLTEDTNLAGDVPSKLLSHLCSHRSPRQHCG